LAPVKTLYESTVNEARSHVMIAYAEGSV